MQGQSKLDAYTINARYKPALIVALPIFLAVLAWFPNGIKGLSVITGLLTWAGGTALLAQIGRDQGKKKEPGLYADWGGQPSIRMLRHRDAPNKVIMARRHSKLQGLIKDIKIPTEQDEKEDPAGADRVYDACCAFLRANTRDKKKFPLIAQENMNYGFRRNLWGMRPFGVGMSLIGIALVGLSIITFVAEKTPVPRTVVVAGILNGILLILWLAWFNKGWVKIAADAYAERLLESCEKL